jgi:flagellar biosynthesis/type III secretory pathway M-ring protein FliF/YscJ
MLKYGRMKMFNLHVLQNQYLILAMGSGLAAVLVIYVVFIMLKRRRSDTFYNEENQSPPGHMTRYLPWVVILTWVGMIAYGIIMTLYNAFNPPNW